MAEKKGNFGCGCIGKKPDRPKSASTKKKPKKSK